ncbi:hypothetical protein [Roseimicrobium sp. ORNL1]|uniref:hypothetical protein n=1 Tax=Roseimicrobium sp. ORNL1 TaxID=2711231 RepID=UPI0013E13795|nr:hypothetical protein [Roseimicrobium sp. ORNL1]QIF04264.1 hypothetical protein G5S37_22985 [Roseimicrobium sp. ORNL1]
MKQQDLLRRTTGRLRLPAANQTTRQDTLAPTATRPINLSTLATATAAVPAATGWEPNVQWRAGLVKRVSSLMSR